MPIFLSALVLKSLIFGIEVFPEEQKTALANLPRLSGDNQKQSSRLTAPAHYSTLHTSSYMTTPHNLAQLGITFHRIPPERGQEVVDFLWRNFFPEEPICRSLGFQRTKNTGMVDWFFRELAINGHSVMALDCDGRIIGVRLAEAVNRDEWMKRCLEVGLDKLLFKVHCIFDKKTSRAIKASYLLITDGLEYSVWNLFDQFKCDKILSGMCLCSRKDSGIRGIGTELLRQSEMVGIEEGCAVSAAVASGNYSGKIFMRAGYDKGREVVYADFKDENGELYLNDVREHICAAVFTKKLLEME